MNTVTCAVLTVATNISRLKAQRNDARCTCDGIGRYALRMAGPEFPINLGLVDLQRSDDLEWSDYPIVGTDRGKSPSSATDNVPEDFGRYQDGAS